MDQQAGILIIVAGAVLILIGVLVWAGGLGWFGRLPGDIRIESETTRVYIPITSMILLSIVLSLILYVLRRIF
jgi:uncharacterized membrane protein YidH (DUF202 family)